MGYDLRQSPYKCLSCETRQQECYCCDTGNDRGQFTITMAGCDGLAGVRTVELYRYRSPQAIATGVSYPATNPCGVFWGTTSNGAGCSAGGTNWGGDIGFLNWCDGTDAAIPWHVEVYCYNADTSTWVSQGEATVTLFECRCGGPYLEFTLPELDCCCDGELIPTCCCPDGIPSALTFAIESTDCPNFNGTTVTLTHDGTDWKGTFANPCPDVSANVNVRLYCVDNSPDPCQWWIELDGDLGFTASATAIGCNPFEVEYVDAAFTYSSACSCPGTFLLTFRVTE